MFRLLLLFVALPTVELGLLIEIGSRIGTGATLALIAVTMFAVAALVDIDRPALGITVVVAFLVLLAWEAVAVAKGNERELEWVS